jgi:hypothetical protein
MNLKPIVTALLACICFEKTCAQSVSTLIGARQAGMGYASSNTADEWSLFNNVGGLGKMNQKSVAFAYEVIPTLIGANRMAAVFNTNLKWGGLSMGAFRFGDDLYSEQLLSIGFGNQFGITSLGMKINYIQYHAESFGTHSTLSIDFGGITQLTKQLSIGASITNLTQSSLQTKEDERLPTRLIVGFGFKLNEKIFINTEIEKDLDYKPTWRTGLEYSIYKSILLRTGYNLNPNAAFFGLGYQKGKLKIDYGVRINTLVGSTHQASAVYLIPAKIKK